MIALVAAAAVIAQTPEVTAMALYDVISGPAGQERNWEKFKSLFVEGATLRTSFDRDDKTRVVVMSVQDYIDRNSTFLKKNGFFEEQISSRLEEFGNTAHLWSTYESRRSKDDEKPFDRGINSIQLVKTENGWKITSVVWTGESANLKIPPKYLPKGG